MMDLATIRAMNKGAANRAKRHAVRPFVPTPEQRQALRNGADITRLAGFRLPAMGDYVPRGWRVTVDAPLFCDKSGFGLESEPAITLRRLGQSSAMILPTLATPRTMRGNSKSM